MKTDLPSKKSIYDSDGNPAPNFNGLIRGWLDGSLQIREHRTPKAFDSLLKEYLSELTAIKKAARPNNIPNWRAHRVLLSNLTKIMLGIDISAEISQRLSSESINVGGFRSTLSQAVAKNTGENFINAIVYAIAECLSHQDEVLVDKGLPPALKPILTIEKTFVAADGETRELNLPIEGDFCVFARSDPTNALVGSAKTRLKEVFHIGTMWALFFKMIEEAALLAKWGLRRNANVKRGVTSNMVYVFATADMVPPGGAKTQGGDVERDEPRNLIAADASFFDYVFVSKQGIPHVATTLNLGGPREALFHELGTILELIGQKYSPVGLSLI